MDSTIQLEKVFRQENPEFVQHLSEIRLGNTSSGAIEYLNLHCYKGGFVPEGDEYSHLCCTGAVRDRINETRLSKLPGTMLLTLPYTRRCHPKSGKVCVLNFQFLTTISETLFFLNHSVTLIVSSRTKIR